jgi:5-methylcytosine-specific restriction protein A
MIPVTYVETQDDGFPQASRGRGPTQQTRELVFERSGGKCEWCGQPPSWGVSVHHRKPRGMGGSRKVHVNAAANLLLLCGSGTTGCHGWTESNRQQAVTFGLLVPRPAFPATTPFYYRQQRWVLLDDNGGIEEWIPDDGAEFADVTLLIKPDADSLTEWLD